MFIWTDEWLLLGFGESGICKISFHFFFCPSLLLLLVFLILLFLVQFFCKKKLLLKRQTGILVTV